MLVAVGFSKIRLCNTPGGLNTPAPTSIVIADCPNDSPTRCRIVRGKGFTGTFGFRSSESNFE